MLFAPLAVVSTTVLPTAAAATKTLPVAATTLPLTTLPGKTVPLTLPTNLPNITSFGKTPLAMHHPWVTHTFAALFVIAAVSLLVLLALQTTKQEGLSGTIGGRVESSYRPRLGFDQQLQRITTFVAVSFVILGLIVSLSGI